MPIMPLNQLGFSHLRSLACLVCILAPRLALSAESQAAAESSPQDGDLAVYAQTIPVPGRDLADAPQPSTAKSAERPRAIEEIVVTATKREESVRDVPISIDAFSGEELANRGAKDLEGILKYSPGVILKKGSASDSSNVTIRGIGGTSKYFNRTFGLFYGDVSLVNPSLAGAQPDIDPFDMASVEILKGPQGTLFGGSALAGAVRYVPTQPTLDAAYGSLGYEYGAVAHSGDANQAYLGMVNLPLGDRFGLRLSGVLRRRAGYTDDLYSGEHDTNSGRTGQGQIQARWDPVDELALRAYYLDRHAESDDSATVDFTGNEDNRYENSIKRTKEPSFADTKIVGFASDLRYFDPFVVTWSSNWLKKKGELNNEASSAYGTDAIPGAIAPQTQRSSTDQSSHELRLVSTENSDSALCLLDNWKYTAGLVYLRSEQFLGLNIPVPTISSTALLQRLLPAFPALAELPDTGDVLLSLGGDVTAQNIEKALYFDFTKYLLSDRLELNFGGRFYDQRAKADLPAELQARLLGPDPTIRIPLSSDQPTLEEKGFNPKFAVTWHQNQDLSVHASAVKGFRFGGFNSDPLRTGEPQPAYKSDTLWNYELGLRTNWLNGQLQWDITAFYLKWNNMQIEEFIRLGLYAYVLNVGASDNPGAETTLRAVLPYGFMLIANLGYSDARFSEAFTTPSGGSGEKGTPLPNSPHLTGSLVLSYESSDSWIDYGADLSYSYQGGSHNDFENHIPLPAFSTWDLSLRAGMPDWTAAPVLTLAISNLTNENAPLSGLYEDGILASYTAKELQRPRTVTLGLTLHF